MKQGVRCILQGLGSSGKLKPGGAEWLRDAGHEYGMPVMTEVRGVSNRAYSGICRYITNRFPNMYDRDLWEESADR